MQDSSWKAILTDLDGTLYSQAALRRRMVLQILRAFSLQPRRGWRTIRILRAYRLAQERLRALEAPCDLGTEQLRLASEWSGCRLDHCGAVVERWMEREPLAHLPTCVRPGARAFFREARQRGLRLAVCSDYPARQKLAALGLEDCFDALVYAQEPEVGRFKPHPRMLQVALQRLGVAPEDTLCLGDRADVDGAAARNAGVRYTGLVPFSQLIHLLDTIAPQSEAGRIR
jgi:HAD superfamily hydrolase (TIGR01509 family)